jgi:polar amino acid transport system permease protein
MPGALTFPRIILPQAMRAILPWIASQAISMIKSTSIASVIMVNELTFRAEQIVGQNFQFYTVFTAAAPIYLAMTSCVAVSQIAAERRFDFLRERGDGYSQDLRRRSACGGARRQRSSRSGRPVGTRGCRR